MFEIKLTYEGKQSMQKVAAEFKSKLSQDEIDKIAAHALNETGRKAAGRIRKFAKQDYTINNKYLQRAAKLIKPAGRSSLYAEVGYSTQTVPMIAFTHREIGSPFGKSNKSNSGVQVEIRKGKSSILKHAFIATMHSGHEGIFMHGHYQGSQFVQDNKKTSSGRPRITEIKSASPFIMYSNQEVQSMVNDYVDKTLAERFRVFLQQKVDKLATK
jgi:hypothetical protein